MCIYRFFFNNNFSVLPTPKKSFSYSSTSIKESKTSTELYKNVIFDMWRIVILMYSLFSRNYNAFYLVLTYYLSNTMSIPWAQSMQSIFPQIEDQLVIHRWRRLIVIFIFFMTRLFSFFQISTDKCNCSMIMIAFIKPKHHHKP